MSDLAYAYDRLHIAGMWAEPKTRSIVSVHEIVDLANFRETVVGQRHTA